MSTQSENLVEVAREASSLSAAADEAFAKELVARARAEGVELVGPDGVLAGLTRTVLEAALEAEMTEHLGYDKHDVEGRNGENSRNGTRVKTVLTDVGPVTIASPRDREGTFAPVIVPKRTRRLPGVDSLVISLSAKGLTTGEVSAHLARCMGQRFRKRRSHGSPTGYSSRSVNGRPARSIACIRWCSSTRST